mmetsp:Transcript_30063/g.73691  ORF Transcript_30063/g.73691 Transcript_30063/m.73691 type:complete len:354 (-) Transcript_30063:289-1350(-)
MGRRDWCSETMRASTLVTRSSMVAFLVEMRAAIVKMPWCSLSIKRYWGPAWASASTIVIMMFCPSSLSSGSWLMIVVTPRMSTSTARAASSPVSAATARQAWSLRESSWEARRSTRMGTAPASIAGALYFGLTARLASAYTACRWMSTCTPLVKGSRALSALSTTGLSSSCMLSLAASSAIALQATLCPTGVVASVVRLWMERSTQLHRVGSVTRCLAHSEHVRTLSLLTPGTGRLCGLHAPHTTHPQHLQWCFLRIVVNSASHRVHAVIPPWSIHVGCSTSPCGAAAAAVAAAVAAALLFPNPKNPPPPDGAGCSAAGWVGAAGGGAEMAEPGMEPPPIRVRGSVHVLVCVE